MYSANMNNAVKQYHQVDVQTGIASATPHRLIQMLLQGALDKIVKAKSFLVHGNIAEKGTHISWAISIIDGLKMSLDAEKGGEIAANLDALYDYMSRRLFEANLKNDPAILDEVQGLLKSIESAWSEIADTTDQAEVAAASGNLARAKT